MYRSFLVLTVQEFSGSPFTGVFWFSLYRSSGVFWFSLYRIFLVLPKYRSFLVLTVQEFSGAHCTGVFWFSLYRRIGQINLQFIQMQKFQVFYGFILCCSSFLIFFLKLIKLKISILFYVQDCFY